MSRYRYDCPEAKVRIRLPQRAGRLGALLLGSMLAVGSARAATFIVDSTGDGGATGSTADGICDSQVGPGVVCTLRAAIDEANGTAGADVIQFNIGGGGPQTLSPGSALPTITSVVTIDGTTQPGWVAAPIIEINGASSGGANCFTLSGAGSAGSTIKGLVIGQFNQGIRLLVGTSGNVIIGNYIGTDKAGTAPSANSVGVFIQNSPNNRIGGALAGERNIISANNPDGIQITGASATGNVIQGNYIGIDATGGTALGNAAQGVAIFGAATNNTVGGTGAGEGNLISGNGNIGVGFGQAGTTGNLVEGNFIGTNAAGTAAVPNLFGVGLQATSTANIIGDAAGSGNVISGNNNSGILIDNSTGNTIQNNRIGTDVSGTADVGNVQHGIHILNGSNNNVIGGAGVGNVISGNDIRGVDLGGSSGNVIEDNIVGRNAANTASIANAGGGIHVDSSNNTVGGTGANVGNIIAGNGGYGVAVTGTATGVAVEQNSIFSNTGLGIDLGSDGVTGNDVDDLDGGQNNLQNYPVLSAAATDGTVVHIAGALDSAPSTTYRVEFFANSTTVGPDGSGFGEGERYLGFANVTTDVNGDAVIGVTLTAVVVAGETVTATATDPSSNSSEFAANVTAVGDLVVTTTADTVDGTVTSVTALIANPGPDGRISLREAIQATNATGGTDTIRFGIPLTDTGRFYYQNDSTPSSLTTVGTTLRADADITDFDPDYVGTAFSWFRIQLGSPMDAILDPVLVDGYTQPGAQANTVAAPAVSDAILKIVLDGSLLGTGDGLNLLSGGTTVRGLVIQKFPGRGVRMATAGGNVLEGCYVGTDPTGTLLASNNNQGIRILAGSNGNTVGGTTPGARNVISGQTSYGIYTAATGTIVQGNFIGTDVTGTLSLANATDGLYVDGGSLSVIGGTSSGARNVISGNGDDGVFLGNGATGNVFQGNYIGVDVTGGGALGNLTHGISFGPSVAGNTIGGTVAGAGNVIAHNTSIGIRTAPTTLSGNSFLSNSIHTNGGRGIDLNADGVTPNDLGDGDSGPNDLLNWPLIYLISEAGGTLTVDYSLDVPAGSYRVEFFKNPSGADPSGNGEGETFASFVNVTHAGAGPQAFSHSFSGSPGDVVTATTTFCTDGATCAAFGSTSEFGNAFVVGVTAVELTSFNAVAADGAVDLFWQTSSELNNLGFHLYRADSEAGTYERITAAAIPGLGSSPRGASYHYRDEGRTNGVTYYYKLEDIDSVGTSEFHGPVSATPREASSDPSDEDLGPTRITVRDPSATAFRVVRRSPDEVVLELETGGFYAEPQEDGSVRLSIPGFDALTEANAPEIPVKRSWVEALAGRQVNLVSVTAREEESFTGLLPSDAPKPEIVAGRNGTVRAARSRSTRGSTRRARTDAPAGGVYPSELARVVSVGFQGDIKKALVELAPLRWDGATGRLLLTHRLIVRLSFRGLEPDEVTTDGIRGRRRRAVRERAENVVVRLATSERGLYAVSFENVFGRKSRHGLSTSELRLSRQGAAVAFHLEPRSDRFGPGSTLYFLSDGAAANPYGNEAVYELELVPGGRTMEEGDASPVGDVVPYYWHTLRREENRYYQAALLDAPDLWLWETILAPEIKSFSFHVDGLASASERSHLRLWLQGASDLPGSPDHHVRVYVNRVDVGELSWDGKQARNIDVALPPDVVLEGENTLEIENVGDTAAAYSMVMLDRFEVVYPRRTAAVAGELEGSWSASGVAELFGLGRNVLLLDTTDPQPRWLDGAQTGADGVARVRAEAGRRYLAVSSSAVLKPQLRIASTAGLARENHRADYLVIAPEAFLPAVAPLIELRRNQGLLVEAVSVEDIYSEFGFGEARPEALQDFLRYAYQAWQSPSLRYVLLVGDATYDFKDYLGTGVRNRVPPLMVETSFLWTASDPSYATVNGEDPLPDLAIGRLPAASVEEARAMVEKILAYENGEAILKTAPVVLVADDADRAGDFRADADELASTTLSGRDVEKIYLSELGVASTRDSILRAFDEGASLVSYVGHGGIHLWASENLFDTSAVDALSPQARQPIVLTMNCLNGYFQFPYFDSLAEALLKAEGKGAVAAFSPSGLSLNDSAHRYHRALLEELLHGGHQRLGDAVMAAQADYARTGALPELLSIYHLFGDPALRLR